MVSWTMQWLNSRGSQILLPWARGRPTLDAVSRLQGAPDALKYVKKPEGRASLWKLNP